ncbi:MAG: hypothetical protein DDT31_01881 [Syntrophomonadaceae bacterium]|nr:hypothetical protein [Bacillota bacterium]
MASGDPENNKQEANGRGARKTRQEEKHLEKAATEF